MLKNIIGTLIDSRYAITSIWSQTAKILGKDISSDDKRILDGILKLYDTYDL